VFIADRSRNTVYLFLGSATPVSQTSDDSHATITGPDDSQFGRSLSSTSDIDGDGVADLLVGTSSRQEVVSNIGFAFSGAMLAEGGSFTTEDASLVLMTEACEGESGGCPQVTSIVPVERNHNAPALLFADYEAGNGTAYFTGDDDVLFED